MHSSPHPDLPVFVDRLVAAPGGRLFVRTWGSPDRGRDRAPILLFHDSLGSVDVWRTFPASLAAATGRAVVAYDRLGFGRSDPHDGPLDLDFIRAEARTSVPAVRAALGIDRMVLFGHSVGGAMAVAAAAAFPDDARAVVTEAAQAFVESRTQEGVREAQAAFEAPDQMERLARYHGDKAPWVLAAWTGTWLAPAFAGWSLDDDLRALRCPVLAMHGARDEYGSRQHPERIVSLSPGRNEMVLFDGCGHVPHREQPDLVVRYVDDFLEARVSD
jgi:pimeloyl-ACP methyl ester carboxylesterase